MGGLCEKPSMSGTLLACLPSQLYQHSCRALSVVVPMGHSNKYYITSLQSNWEKSEGPFPSVPSPGLRKPESGQWILDRYWGWPLMSMSFKENAGSMLLDRLPGELPSQWGPVSMGLRVGTAAAGEGCHGHPRQVADPPPAHSFSNPGQDRVLHSHSIADIYA